MENQSYNPLPITTQALAVENANKKIYRNIKTKYPGLISRWPKINRVVGGSFRFHEIITIAAPSGAGKSFFLNMLRSDFAGDLNKNYPHKFKILSFSFEMEAVDEVIRSYSTEMGISYSDLVSSNSKLPIEYYKKIESQISSKVENDIIYYVESSGNRERMKATVNKTAA